MVATVASKYLSEADKTQLFPRAEPLLERSLDRLSPRFPLLLNIQRLQLLELGERFEIKCYILHLIRSDMLSLSFGSLSLSRKTPRLRGFNHS
jgi:hypothetical protein